MNCPHCQKVIIVKVFKDDGKDHQPVSRPASNAAATEDLGELLDMAEGRSLSGSALAFVTETRERYKKYGDKTRMSEKQLAWLEELANPETEEEWS